MPTKIKVRFLHIPTKTYVEEIAYASGSIDKTSKPGFKKFQGKLDGETDTGDRELRCSDLGTVLAFMSQSEDTITSIP